MEATFHPQALRRILAQRTQIDPHEQLRTERPIFEESPLKRNRVQEGEKDKLHGKQPQRCFSFG